MESDITKDKVETKNTESVPANAEQPPKLPLTKKQKAIKEVKSLSVLILIILIFRSVFFEPFRIPSGSMIPTLMIGDFILVNKMAYGFKLPFSDFFGDPVYLFGKSNPKRGDVVVFKYPKDTSVNYIKRIIGLPGDVIEIKNKIVYVNDKPIDVKDITGTERSNKILEDMDDKFKGHNLKLLETKTGEHSHIIQQDNDNYYKVDYEKLTVPEGKFFAMGDNRDFSYDSRFWGFIPHEYIKGKALFVWFSFILPFSENDMKLRPWRIGTCID